MRTFNQWMDEYGVSHKNHTNQMIHKICVPLIMLSIIGMLWSIPTPEVFHQIPYLNWATLLSSFALLFYLSLNLKYFVGMIIQLVIMSGICVRLESTGILPLLSIIVFVLAWIGQFYGHKVEGKKPSFLQDVFFLLIGPLWVTRFFYQMIGIKD